jgi:hypothetical protein
MELHNQTPPVRGIVVVIVIGRPYLWRYPGIFVDRFPSGGYGFSEDMSETRPPLRLGYARVSTVGRTLEAQFDQLKAAGCSGIYRERVSGAKVDREERGKMSNPLRPVTKWSDGIDRLARSTFELFAIVKRIVARAANSKALQSHGLALATGTPLPTRPSHHPRGPQSGRTCRSARCQAGQSGHR